MIISENKSYKIQLLRGVAIIAVVAIHNAPDGLAQVWIRPFVNFCVGLFIFLSGLLSCASKYKPWKRIKKIIIPYLIWTLIYIVGGNLKTPMRIPISYLRALITGKAAMIMYYVFVYCELTLLIPLVEKLAKSKLKYLGLFISPLEIIIFRLLPIVFGIELNDNFITIRTLSCLGWFIYFYLGYLIGNNCVDFKLTTPELIFLLCLSCIFQISEGYLYYYMGEANFGTQLKLSSIMTGVFFVLLAYKYICLDRVYKIKWLKLLGDYSFGIYFSHLAIQYVLVIIPFYSKFVIFPLNVIVVTVSTTICVYIGNKILGKYAKYLAL